MAGPGGSGAPVFFPQPFWSQQQFQHPMMGHHQAPQPIASPLPQLFPSAGFPPLSAANGHPPPPGAYAQRNPLSPSANYGGGRNESRQPSPPTPKGGPGEATPGIGELVWLSSKAGLIKCAEGAGSGSVSFQLKDFCDQAVSDLTSVLRPGFILQYWAHTQGGDAGSGLVATFVRPLPNKAGGEPGQKVEATLEAPPAMDTGPPQLPKDPYNLELEAKAVPVLLDIFKRNGLTYCQLSGFHTAISNCGDDDLYRYVGTSSLKRRQFLERRTHVFHIAQTDTVSLQPAPLYTTLCRLNAFLLGHGGACFLQQLFDHFGACPEIPLEAREMIGEGKTSFLRFLEAHPWIFSVFPSRVFVSARRQLIHFDYPSYMHENFGDQDPGFLGEGIPGARQNGSPGSGDRPPQTPTLPASELRNSTTAFGSNSSLDGAGTGGPPSLASSIPPTPTSGGPPVMHWAQHPPPPVPTQGLMGPPPPHQRYDAYSAPPPPNGYTGRGSLDARSPTMGAPPPAPYPEMLQRRGWTSGPTPPVFPPGNGGNNGVGGRIKRFTDVEGQTERPSLGDLVSMLGCDVEMLRRYLRRPAADAACQTGEEARGPPFPGVLSKEEAVVGGGRRGTSRSSADENSLSSPSIDTSAPHSEDGPTETGVLTGLEGLTGGGGAYDPMMGSDNLLSRGLLNSLNL